MKTIQTLKIFTALAASLFFIACSTGPDTDLAGNPSIKVGDSDELTLQTILVGKVAGATVDETKKKIDICASAFSFKMASNTSQEMVGKIRDANLEFSPGLSRSPIDGSLTFKFYPAAPSIIRITDASVRFLRLMMPSADRVLSPIINLGESQKCDWNIQVSDGVNADIAIDNVSELKYDRAFTDVEYGSAQSRDSQSDPAFRMDTDKFNRAIKENIDDLDSLARAIAEIRERWFFGSVDESGDSPLELLGDVL